MAMQVLERGAEVALGQGVDSAPGGVGELVKGLGLRGPSVAIGGGQDELDQQSPDRVVGGDVVEEPGGEQAEPTGVRVE
ncbi:hypothetical protein [Tautonia sociabilis]|uniref:Uncharacterized protein n=1 Tax=Tautonia sociabilis TaxID=2080755 RepID=A0A432ME39_9BACT|nr:hypothetical protein [Tautonia sociabilis]RUL83417.1 hypothetical protein TsocGM_22165 [Tautonia sociabilis]